ncbi:luciferin 4-monooxygenase-like [Calliphora vicina]|uniref:luciferin 4-monooxygenase-like n=1 Tax=Calliphora vicina TaxID=7373 RepID=UPI00325AB0E7
MDQLVAANYDKHSKIWSGPKMEPLYNVEHHSVGKILYGQMRNYPNKVIQIDDVDNKNLTNREALTWAVRIAQHFKKMRLRYDDVVGIAARNTTYLMPVAVACFLNSVPFHAVSPMYDEKSLSHCFGITKPEIIFCDGSDYEKIRLATKSFRPLIYTVSEHIEGVASVLDLLQPTKTEIFYQPEKLSLGSDQTVAILCSSGTTGLPKAVTISVNKLMFDNPIITSEDVIYTNSGLDWMSGLMTMTFSCYSGCTRIISRKTFTPEYFVELSRKYKITNATLAPSHVVALTQCPSFTTENMETLKALQCGGGCITTKTLEKAQTVLPRAFICFGYGFTEAGGVSGYFGLERGNSVGKLVPNIRLRIQDEQGNNLGPNEVGEIQVHYPHHWAGYYGNPIETQRIRDSLGWFHSGDLGYMDEDGFLYVIDRKKEICKYLSEHYWPSEIENCIRELNDVVDCCVVGIFDEYYGDLAGALVVKVKGSSLKEHDIVDHVKNRLQAKQKQLHNGVLFVDELPHNFNGKIVKREARELFVKLKNLNGKI